MSEPEYRPDRDQAIAALELKAEMLLAERDLLELFDVRGLPKPEIPVGGGHVVA